MKKDLADQVLEFAADRYHALGAFVAVMAHLNDQGVITNEVLAWAANLAYTETDVEKNEPIGKNHLAIAIAEVAHRIRSELQDSMQERIKIGEMQRMSQTFEAFGNWVVATAFSGNVEPDIEHAVAAYGLSQAIETLWGQEHAS